MHLFGVLRQTQLIILYKLTERIWNVSSEYPYFLRCSTDYRTVKFLSYLLIYNESHLYPLGSYCLTSPECFSPCTFRKM